MSCFPKALELFFFLLTICYLSGDRPGNDDAEEKVEENNDSQITMEGLSNWWDNLINSNDTNINACGIGNLPTKCECDDGKSHSPQDIYKDDENNM